MTGDVDGDGATMISTVPAPVVLEVEVSVAAVSSKSSVALRAP